MAEYTKLPRGYERDGIRVVGDWEQVGRLCACRQSASEDHTDSEGKINWKAREPSLCVCPIKRTCPAPHDVISLPSVSTPQRLDDF
jgi:hypothetical protein